MQFDTVTHVTFGYSAEDGVIIAQLRQLDRAALAALVNPYGFEFDPALPEAAWSHDDAIVEYLEVLRFARENGVAPKMTGWAGGT